MPDLRFKVGDELYFMGSRMGRVATFTHGTHGFDPYTINIGGPVDAGEQMLVDRAEAVFPRLVRCFSFHHPFEFGGDLESAYAYYYALRRIHAIMGVCVREQRKAA